MSKFEEHWEYARFRHADEDIRRIAARAYEESALRELCPYSSLSNLRLSRKGEYPYDPLPYILTVKSDPRSYELRGAYGRPLAKGPLDLVVPLAVNAMTWVDSPHEGYLVAFIKASPDGAGWFWQELDALDPREFGAIERIAIGCDCGWRSPALAAPSGTRWSSCRVWFPDEAHEELARSTWIGHCGALRGLEIEDSGVSLQALAQLTRGVLTPKLRDAAEVLRRHFREDGGMIDGLRPYTGSLNPEALSEALSAARAIRVLAENGEAVPLAVATSIFNLTNTVRRWALDPESMLVSNNLIRPSESKALLAWVSEMETEFSSLLGILQEREEASED